jgi:hypothetical protein
VIDSRADLVPAAGYGPAEQQGGSFLTPLRITPAGCGVYRVIEGHRRLAAEALPVSLGGVRPGGP